MKDLIATHADQLDALASKTTATLTEILNRQIAAINQARESEWAAVEQARKEQEAALQEMATETAAVVEAYRAEAEQAIQEARSGLAAKTAEFLGDTGPSLPKAGVPFEFGLIVPSVEGASNIGASALRAIASHVETESGEVLKSRSGSSPAITLHQNEIERAAEERGYEPRSLKDICKAVTLAYADKMAERAKGSTETANLSAVEKQLLEEAESEPKAVKTAAE